MKSVMVRGAVRYGLVLPNPKPSDSLSDKKGLSLIKHVENLLRPWAPSKRIVPDHTTKRVHFCPESQFGPIFHGTPTHK